MTASSSRRGKRDKSKQESTGPQKGISIFGEVSPALRPITDQLIHLSINFLNTPGLMCVGGMSLSIDGCSDISRISFSVHGRNHWCLWSFVAGKVSVKMRVSNESGIYSAVITSSPLTAAI